ncbi:hypothetical protein BJF83_20835 [Nocardiopsis sp. CNR-923]|uniref:hypothetical protein n=1 Tax=Nocardiopsis sp. CNR-923 TaxID=1904965 RepID=UPI00095CF544|nr:hypothetical protein [Nocardiopsis sp. CNR-923]OLT26534.1 hypothetical protein BJF83_20835 [Nocardiopsis sp. CNR-923]
MGAWATVEHVKAITGFDATEGQVLRAEHLIELMSGADLDSTTIGARDRKRLRAAVAYQTVFMGEHPDVFTNVDADIIRQDGVDVDFSHANAGLLAPLAHRALRRLSWRGTRTRRVAHRKRVARWRDDWDYDTFDPRWRDVRGFR